MRNKELAEIFSRIADALEFKGEMAFKVIAYRKAARVLEDLTEDIEKIAQEGKLETLPGIGEGIAKKIEEYLKTGKMKKYEEAVKGIPEGLLELLNIQNLGPKTLALAHRELGVKNLADLKRVIEDGSLKDLFGMGEKKVENIKKGIELYEQGKSRMGIDAALAIAEEVCAYLKKNPLVKSVSPSGSLRRMKETIGDIDILVTGRDGAKIIDYFTKFPKATRVLAAGETKGSIMVGLGKEAKQVDIRVVPEKTYGAALQYFTGSKAHNIKLRLLAKEKGLKISEYGVFKGEKFIAGRTEEEVYSALGLPFIPPELREDRGEIEAALANRLPKLISYHSIKGDLQVHTTYSDGNASLEEVVKMAEKIGYEYIAITDHSQSVRYAHGLDEKRLRKQIEEIMKLREKSKVKIFTGIEVDILPDGSLDFPDSVLKELDVVVAAVHQGFKKNVTERIISAIENPYVAIIAHPSGRLISRREGYDVDLEKVLEWAKKYNKVLELNAYPDRLDLDDLHLRKAKDMGIKICINTDAHGSMDMYWMRFGIGIARRGWLEEEDVINTYPYQRLIKFLKDLRR
ncbi:MAG: DNA polymerase/3'-5' exonuclease PolX [candidate division WOR-3 bacterium]